MLRSISLALVAVSMLALGLAGEARTGPTEATGHVSVVIPEGDDFMIASVVAQTGPVAEFGLGALNATQMALDDYGPIKGFDSTLNEFDGACDGGAGSAAAVAIVADPKHLGVVGHLCSGGMAAGLPIYEAASVVTISGSTTGVNLPAEGPTVFNRTIVDEPNDPGGFGATVRNQPQYLTWEAAYVDLFGVLPATFSEFFYDAATLLLTRIDEVATIDGNGDLVINRTALAAAVRDTTDFRGITCDITLDLGGTRVADPNDLSPCEVPTPTPATPTATPATQTPSPTPAPPGDVSGSVFNDANGDGVLDDGESGIPGVSVCTGPSGQCAQSGPSGEYSFTVPSGLNRVSVQPVSGLIPTTDLSETVDVPPAGAVGDVDFGFRDPLPVPPEVDLGDCAEESGGITLVFGGCPLVVEKDVTDHCGAGQPLEVTLVVRFPSSLHTGVMTNTSGEIWEYTVPVGGLIPGSSASLEFHVDCPPDTAGFPADLSLIGPEDEIQLGGDIYIDPSGTIEDVCSGTPVEGATVTLLVESPAGSGTFVQATSGLIPSTNPQVTAGDGLYGWMTVAGVYKVRAEKAGYGATESTEITIPPAVTDLILALTPTGGCQQVIWGDNNCSGSAGPVDSLLTLRYDAGLSTNTGDCPDFGQVVEVQDASPHPWGDVDCSGNVTPVDSLKLLRFDAGLSVSQADGCPEIGSQVSVTE